jgi:hypothetical protein
VVRSTAVEERVAEGKVEHIYHDIKQTLRVSGVSLAFQNWASHQRFLVAMWSGMRPNVETRAFEHSADELRLDAARAAVSLGPLGALEGIVLGDSQRFHLHSALELYHYMNPKLLIFASAVLQALRGEQVGRGETDAVERIERGVPPRMAAMELVPERGLEKRVRSAFREIRKSFSLSEIQGDYRTLALWPEYLHSSWRSLRQIVSKEGYLHAVNGLRDRARALALDLPFQVPLSREKVEALEENVDQLIELTAETERTLPLLIVNAALFLLDFVGAEKLRSSPFPPAARTEPAWAH